MAFLAPPAGPRCVGKYELLEKIADGGMGSVYKGRHATSGEFVAVKVLAPERVTSKEVLLKRFEQEFHAARALDHPNIVRALDFGREGPTPYLVLEFVDGESLGDRIEREGRLSEEAAVGVVVQIARALEAMHGRAMVHRDVKPDNILLNNAGQAKLTDLGLIKDAETQLHLTQTGGGLGTPHFMAPEQFRNAKQADRRCDIYGLGATLYMAVTGELPFAGLGPVEACMKKLQNDLKPPRERVPGLSSRVDWAIRRAMSADPGQRPTSCAEFIEDLTGHSNHLEPAAGASSAAERIWQLVRNDPAGTRQSVQGTVEVLRRLLQTETRSNLRTVLVSPGEAGTLGPLSEFAEFRDLVIEAATVPVGAGPATPRVGVRHASAAPVSPAPAGAETRTNGKAADAQPMPEIGERFDLMTCLMIVFFVVGGFSLGWHLLAH